MLAAVGDPLSRVLFCAFAEVPGPSSAGTRTAQWLSVLGHKEADALCLKGKKDAHIQRYGGARMMRVPNTVDKPFLERLSTYQRALQRQLKGGDSYDLVWCADLFSASAAAPHLPRGTPLVVEIAEVPSLLASARALVGDSAEEQSAKWLQQEKVAIRAATRVIAPSRHAAKLLSERVDARLMWIIPRCIDRSAFSPPTVEVAIEDERRVLVFGGREGRLTRAAVSLAHGLASRLAANVRIGILGAPGNADAELKALLEKRGLKDRVDLVDADGPQAVTAALSLADVVVVPSCAEDEAEPFAIPHRALEAMACGRAVVITGPDGAFRETAIPGEHFQPAPARDPLRAADAVSSLLADGTRRDALARAAARHLERSADLMARADEIRAQLLASLKVRLKVHKPRVDNPDTSSRSVSEPEPVAAGPNQHTTTSGPALAPAPASSSGPSQMPSPLDGPTGEDLRRVASSPLAPGGEPAQTVRVELAPGNGLWEGDTFLDGGLPAALESADPTRVREAMLVSSDARRSKSDPSRDLPSVSPSAVQSLEASAALARPPTVRVFASDASPLTGASSDPWGPDTIADGTPLEAPRATGEGAAPRTHLIKSLLVEALPPQSSEDPNLTRPVKPATQGGVSDLTVEDDGPLTSSED